MPRVLSAAMMLLSWLVHSEDSKIQTLAASALTAFVDARMVCDCVSRFMCVAAELVSRFVALGGVNHLLHMMASKVRDVQVQSFI